MAIALIAFANAASWALITPAFNAPDEPDHFAYAQYFAETGHAPERVPGPRAPYSTDQTLALNAVNVFSQVALPDGRPPWLAHPAERLGTRNRHDPPPGGQRRRLHRRRPRPTSRPTTRCSRPPTWR